MKSVTFLMISFEQRLSLTCGWPVLRGPNAAVVSALHTRVQIDIDTAVQKLPPTHFVCAPLDYEPWLSAFSAFRCFVCCCVALFCVSFW